MAYDDELAALEAERDRLRSMIAYQERPSLNFPLTPNWFRFVVFGVTCGIGVLIAAGVLAGQIDLSFVVLSIVFLALAAYILTGKMNVFGSSIRVGDIFGILALSPELSTPGESQIRQRLADCEVRIMQLKEGRP